MLIRLIAISNFGGRNSDSKRARSSARMFSFPKAVSANQNHLLPPLPVGRGNLAQELDFIQAFSGSLGHRTQWIFRHVHRQSGFLTQQSIETAQERAPAGQDESAIDQIGRELGRTTLEGDANGIDN